MMVLMHPLHEHCQRTIKYMVRKDNKQRMEKYKKLLWINVLVYFVGVACDWFGGFLENMVVNVIGWTAFSISVGILCYVFFMLKKEGHSIKDNRGNIPKGIKVMIAVIAGLAVVELVAVILFAIRFS